MLVTPEVFYNHSPETSTRILPLVGFSNHRRACVSVNFLPGTRFRTPRSAKQVKNRRNTSKSSHTKFRSSP